MSIQGKHFGIFCIFFLIGIVVSAGTVSGAETCDSELESSNCGSATDVTILSSVPTIASWDISPTSVNPGSSFTAYYYINNPYSTNKDAWLGASIRKTGTENVIDDPSHDKVVTLTKGAHWYSRTFTVKADAAPGSYDVILGLHGGNEIGSGPGWDYTKWQNKLTVTQPPANAIPTLSNGYVTPLSDVSSTTFTYFVTYKDSDGDAPVTKSVNIDGSGGSHSHTMTYVSGSYSSGAIYKYKSNLPLGGHSYYFHFSDGKDDVNFPSSGTSSGPSVADPTIANNWYISPTSVNPGSSFTAYYYINNPHSTNKDAWLGASIRKTGTTNAIDDPSHDKVVTLTPGTKKYSRTFRVKADAAPGSYDVILGLHGGKDIGSGAEWCYTKWQNELTVTQPLTNLVVTIQSPTKGFSVSKGTPTTVSAKITDNLEKIIPGASLVKATFTNGDDDLVLLDDGAHGDGAASDGVYANTWTPQTTAQGYTETACTIKVTAYHSKLSSGYDEVNGVINYPKLIMIELTPSSHDFGEVQTTVSTAPFSFTLKNVGGGTATGEVSLTGSGKDQFIITSGKGSFSLDADQTKTIGVAFSPTSAGSKSATLYAKGSNCNDDQSSLSGTGEEGVSTLSADFTIEPSQNINLGDVVTFDPSLSLGDILLYHWDFGDGETEPPITFPDKIKHLYKSSGTFTVKLKVSTADGNSKSLAKTVNVNSKYENSILITYLVNKDITSVDYTFNAIYTKYAPITVRIEKYSNSDGLPVVVVGNAIKNQPLDYITANKICEEIAVQGVLYLLKEAGYSVTGIGGILNLIRVVDFIDFIQGYNFIEFDVTNDNGDLTVYLPYESAKFDKTEPIGDQTPMGEDSINNKINKQISTPDNLQFQKTPEQLIYVSKPDIGLSEDTDQKFAYMKKIDPSALPEGITFYYEPLKKVEKAVSLLPKLRITVKREIYRHSPVLKPIHLKDVPLIGVPIRVDGKDIGSTSSGGVLEVTEADLNKFGISPFGSHSLEAGDGTFYSKKTVQFDFANEGMTKVDIVLDKCKLPDTPSYATIIIETPTNYPDSVIYPHAKSIENFINNKGILAEDLHVYDIFVDAKCIISGSDWVVVLFHSENVDNDYRLHNPGGFLAYVDTKPTKPLRSGSGWQIIRYEYKSVDTEDILQHVYCIVYSDDKTDTVETAVKEFFEIMEQEFGGSDGLNQLISTSIETAPDPPSTNFGTVPKDQTRTWDFFITNSGSDTLTWTITCDPPSWLNVNRASGSTTTLDVVTVTIDTHDLTPGTHTGHITIDSNGGRKIGTITVTVPPPAQEPKLCISPDPPTTNFGTVPEDQTRTRDFFITNCGSGTLTWEITCDQPSWLNVNPAIGSTTTLDVVTVTIDTHDLLPGTHTGHISLTSNGGEKTGTITVNVQKEPDKLPDLQIHSMLIEPNPCKSTDVVYANFDLKNAGDADVSGFDITLLFEGVKLEVFEISEVVKQDESFPVSILIKTPREGKYTVCLDYSNKIKESNDDNNCASAYLEVKASNQPPENPTLTPDRSSPQLAGTTIKWTASATDPDGDPLYYQFRLKGPATGNSWAIKRDWSTARTWTGYTTASDAGESDISVRIRDGHHASKSSYDLKKTVYDYKITADKKRPTATIDSITPNPATQGDDTVRFKGQGYDSDGYIVEYYWKSSKDGKLSSSKEFTKSASNLDVGTHTISFKVKDNDGLWSNWATMTLTIKEKKEDSKYVKFRGVVTWKSALRLGGASWIVNVDEWISGSISCDEIEVIWGSGLSHGSFDPDISTGDRVEAYGKVNPWGGGKCTVGLNDESYYIKKV